MCSLAHCADPAEFLTKGLPEVDNGNTLICSGYQGMLEMVRHKCVLM